MQVVAGHGGVVVEAAVLGLGRGPGVPAIGGFEDEDVPLAFQGRLGGLVLFQTVEVLEEQEPGGLFRVVQFGGAAGLFPEDIVDVLERLFKHGGSGFLWSLGAEGRWSWAFG